MTFSILIRGLLMALVLIWIVSIPCQLNKFSAWWTILKHSDDIKYKSHEVTRSGYHYWYYDVHDKDGHNIIADITLCSNFLIILYDRISDEEYWRPYFHPLFSLILMGMLVKKVPDSDLKNTDKSFEDYL